MKQPRLEDFRHTMEQCNHCGQCKWILAPKARGVDFAEICPIHMRFGFDAYSGQGLLNMAQEVIEGTLALTPDMVEAVYTCTTCGACDTNCKSVRDMEVLETILALRRRIVDSGAGPPVVHCEIADKIATTHNQYGQPHAQRFAWLSPEVKLTEGAEIIYYVGDHTAYQYPQLALNTARILTAAGIAFDVLGTEEWNDGDFLWRTGQAAAAEITARHNIEALKARGAKTVVCSDAESLSVMRDFYPRIADLPVRVVHITELVQQALAGGRLKFTRPVNRKVTFHDPCYLGRLSEPYVHWNGEIQAYNRHVPAKEFRRGTYGIYDAPRAILSAIPGLELVEMVRNGEASLCCGAGGGVAESNPQFAQWTARERLREAKATGADALVSGAPVCQCNLEKAMQADALTYFDITQIIVDAL